MQLAGGEASVILDEPKLPTDLAANTDVTIDVCLLGDNAELLTILDAAGFVQDPDVLDTWFSSALWPFSTLGWPDPASANQEEGQPELAYGDLNCLDYYYPGSCLVTGRDIITLWVARMVIAGLYCLGDIPFTDVFLHANILDGKGEKMSKSKGNGIDPVDVIDSYGTDAMRYILCDMQTGTQDIRLPVTATCPSCGHDNDLGDTRHGQSIFTYVCGVSLSGKKRDDSCGGEFDVLGTLPDLPKAKLTSHRFDIGRGFCNKLWNSARFALMNLDQPTASNVTVDDLALEDRWLLHRLNKAVAAVNAGLASYNPSTALGAARDFFWGDLCDWYLEVIKPRIATPSRDAEVARAVLAYGIDQVLRLLHPFLPFITEHLWQKLNILAPNRSLGQLAAAVQSPLLINAAWPRPLEHFEDDAAEKNFSRLQDIVRGLRELRSELNIALRKPLEVTIRTPASEPTLDQTDLVANLLNLSAVHIDPMATRTVGMAAKVVGDIEILVHNAIDEKEERVRLDEELARVEGEIAICNKQLANERFVGRAPAHVVQKWRDRLAGYEAQKATIQETLAAF
jgi:valyl-tRNA synthetase